MKRNYFKYIFSQIAIIMAILFIASCNKYLDKAPDNRTEINSSEKIAQLLASAYPKASYAAMLESRIDYVVDKGVGTENNSNTDPFYWRDVTDISQDTPDWFWQRSYYSIAEVNHALEAVSLLDAKGQSDVQPYVGEAYMIRAFSHFLLASLYTKFFDVANDNTNPGIPYITEPETVVIKQYDRRNVLETKKDIEKDLENGLALLGSDAVYNVPRYHFNYKAAHAFAARYYLFTANWAKVIEHASNIIPVPSEFTENGNVAVTDPANVYADNNFQPWNSTYRTVPSSSDIKAYYTNGSNPSNLLLTEMVSRQSRYANTWRYGMDGANSNYLYRINVTGAAFGYRIYSSSSIHYYVPKYREHFVRTSINATTGSIYTIFPFLRNEEVLLNRAEAYTMLGQYDKAINDLNVFARKLIPTYSETQNIITESKLISFYNALIENEDNFMNKYDAYGSASWEKIKKALILCILDFRNQEFKWEGLRYWDMMRYKIPITHINFSGEENTLYPGDDRWILQIPESAKLSGLELNPRTNLLSKEW